MSLPRGLRNNNEEWRDIPGYKGLYQVSSAGNVKSLPKYHSKIEKMLKGYTDKDGYIKVRLCLNTKIRKSHFVHRFKLKKLGVRLFFSKPLPLILRYTKVAKIIITNSTWGILTYTLSHIYPPALFLLFRQTSDILLGFIPVIIPASFMLVKTAIVFPLLSIIFTGF